MPSAPTCNHCGGHLNRVHRTTLERLFYVAAYQCDARTRKKLVRYLPLRRQRECCCPRCGSSRVVRLKRRDQIDKMETGLWNLLARGKSCHCSLCRLQFYDCRPLARSVQAEAKGTSQPKDGTLLPHVPPRP